MSKNQTEPKKLGFHQVRDIIGRYREASTQRERLKVANSLKNSHPDVAARLHALATESPR